MRSQLALQMDESSFDLPATQAPISQRENAGAYNDLSVNQDLNTRPQTKHEQRSQNIKPVPKKDPG